MPDTFETTIPHIDELGTPASNNHYNTGWAWALDTPFPYWKRWAGAEGGTADMCIVAWPAKIPASDEVRHQYVHAVDVVPTVYDLLGIEPPEVIKGYLQSPIEGESFAAALTDASVPGKRTQFYTMLGQRSIYHDGWLACTVHPPLSSWGNFDKDEWELFHLETDRSQSTNVAADHPERLEELKGLWFYYAGIYNGLPLDDRNALEQVLAERPHGAPDRDQYIFYPGASDVPESAGPQLPGRSYTIAAGVEVTSDDVEGVIWAAGGVPGGHSLYVKDGTLRYTFNWVGTQLQDVVAETPLTAGTARVRRGVRRVGAQQRPGDARHRGHADALRRRPAGGTGDDRHPARLLLSDRRRDLRRPGQRVRGDARVLRTVPLHGRHDRQGRRRRLRRRLREPRAEGRCLVRDRLIVLPATQPEENPMGLRHRRDERSDAIRFQMREEFVSIGDDSWIEDGDGNRAYKANGKAARLRDTFVLEDMSGHQVAKIKERALHVRDTMTIDLDGRSATVKKALVGIRDRYHVEVDGSEDLKVHGNIVDHEYEIEQSGDTIAEVSKKWFRVRDTYGVEVRPGADIPLILSVVVAIDAMARD